MPAIKLPRPADNIASATVLRWLVSPGDRFAAGAGLVELETEEATVVVKAKDAGILTKTSVAAGQTISVGCELAHVETTRARPMHCS